MHSLLFRVGLPVVIIAAIIGLWYNHAKTNSTYTSSQGAAALTTGNSNEDLDKDLMSVDAALRVSDSDLQNVDQGLNDKPISQE
jgi:uncharacterized protein (UPF0333 family)